MDANLVMFEEVFVPLLAQAKARGLTFRVEQCPMPGWNVTDTWHKQHCLSPGHGFACNRICERHGVGDQFRIHYDPSQCHPDGTGLRSVFQYLKDSGYNFLIGGFHVKGQVIDSRGISAWGYGGQTMQRGDWHGNGRAPIRPSSRTPGRSRPCFANTSCRAVRAMIHSRICKSIRRFGSIISSPRVSCFDRAGEDSWSWN